MKKIDNKWQINFSPGYLFKSGFSDHNQGSLQHLVIPKSGQMPAEPTEAKKRSKIPYTVTCTSFELRIMDPLLIHEIYYGSL